MHGRLHRPQVLQPAKFIIFNAQFIVLNVKFIVFDTNFIMFTHDHAPPPGLPAALGLQRTSSAERGRRARFRRRVPKPGLPPSLGPCGENGSPELRPEYGGRAPPPSPPPPPVSSLRGQIVSEKQEEKVGKKSLEVTSVLRNSIIINHIVWWRAPVAGGWAHFAESVSMTGRCAPASATCKIHSFSAQNPSFSAQNPSFFG